MFACNLNAPRNGGCGCGQETLYALQEKIKEEISKTRRAGINTLLSHTSFFKNWGREQKENMTKKLVWRLTRLPEPSELTDLVNKEIMTKEEAREILFKTESEEDRDNESLKSEIKFLKEIIEKLGTPNKIIETIRYIEKPYYRNPWIGPYTVWCSDSSNITNAVASSNLLGSTTTEGRGSITLAAGSNGSFSSIKTF